MRPRPFVWLIVVPLAALLTLGLVLLGNSVFSPRSHPPSRDRSGLPTGPVSYEEVSAHPEASLFYPGSRVFRRIGHGEEPAALTPERSPAFAGAILMSTATPATLYEWYSRWLADHRWHRSPFPRLATWESHQGYRRGERETFIVAVDNPNLLGLTIGQHVPANETVYEIRYTILVYKPGR